MKRIIRKLEPAIPKLPRLLRVAAYARVSSGKDAMLHSLSAQVSYYSKLIQNTPSWQYAGVYADEALSGTKDCRREFQRMLADCRAGKIDRIITKSISRFARNTVTTLETVRELSQLGVDVHFEEQNIHTLGAEGEIVLTLLAAYAEEEARSVSANQKWRIEDNFKQGRIWSTTMFGYTIQNGVLTPVPEEAAVIRKVAELYLQGVGRTQLERAVAKLGFLSRQGKPLRGAPMIDLICNEKVAGDMLLQKTYVSDPITKVGKVNRGERTMYHIEGSHEAILDRETYEKVLAERKRRAALCPPHPGRPTVYPFTGKVLCQNCGKYFRRRIAGYGPYKKPVWICSTFFHKGKAVCPAKQIPERILEEMTAKAMGLPHFDAAAFAEAVTEIQVPENGVLNFIFRDGHTVHLTWDNPSRRESWTPEMRQQAREASLRRLAEGGDAVCRQ